MIIGAAKKELSVELLMPPVRLGHEGDRAARGVPRQQGGQTSAPLSIEEFAQDPKLS
jgi:hypothetical protein